jgi:hypothetical protein
MGGAPPPRHLGEAMPSRLWNLVAGGGSTASDEWPADLESGGRVADHDDIRRVIETCCQANAEALVLSFEDEAVCPMRFLEMGDETFRLSVEGDLPPLLRPPTQCSVSLRFGQRNRVFIATVLAVRPGEISGGTLELVLRIPGEIAAGDPRMAFRVPILKPSDLAMELRADGLVIDDARPLNLSLIGMLIEVSDSDVAVADHAKFEVVLRRGEVQVTLQAELRRRYERRMALFFPDVLDDGSLEPPDELRFIVRELELLWLRQRAR